MAKKVDDRKVLKDELIKLILKKTNVTKADVINEALTSFVASNLDLLTPTERNKFKSILI